MGTRGCLAVGFLADFDLAEEAAQEAFTIAAERWPRAGVPDNPGAWLLTTARNRAIDRIRRVRTLQEKPQLLERPAPPSVDDASAEQLRALISKGATGFTVGFTTDDCQQLYETLKARGVEFTQEPVQQSYGIDMGLRDSFGNHIRVVQPTPPTGSRG